MNIVSRLALRPILWLVALLHIVTGIMLTLDERVALVTGLRFIAETSKSADVAGLIFITAGLCSVWALVHEHDLGPSVTTFWMLIPAQALLLLVASGPIWAIYQGHYASGTVLPRVFIFTDQLSKLFLAVFHPLGVYRMHKPIFPEGHHGV